MAWPVGGCRCSLANVTTGADSADFAGVIARAFPRALAGDAAACAGVVSAAPMAPLGEFAVRAGSEELRIPCRIYSAEPGPDALAGLAPRARLMVGCVYTRHHDGHVRQRNLERISAAPYPWVVPYVVCLAGEYVIEIIDVIEAALTDLASPGSPQRVMYGRFAAENPAFMNLTLARAVSYWNECYRRQYPSITGYPGHRLLASLQAAGRDYAAAAGQGGDPRDTATRGVDSASSG